MSDTLIIQSHAGPYEVRFCSNPVELLMENGLEKRHFIIDRRIADLYSGELKTILDSASVLLVDAREDNKSLERFPEYVEHFVSRGLRRDEKLVAIGGGIIQDITCFIAATMLRGVEWEFLPTTLLAQADSCIGSKSSINCRGAKNILGTFTPPRTVYIDVGFLKTLDERDVRSGIGEMLKVHVIDGRHAFDQIAVHYDELTADDDLMVRFIRRSLEIKKGYIERDEFDRGPRNIFNYGHTFGHAIEAATHFAIPHGIAVTIGMDMANFVAARIGVGDQADFERMHDVLRKNFSGYETHAVPLQPFIDAIKKDKKNVGKNDVTLILVHKDGSLNKVPHPADVDFAGLCQHYLESVRNT